jgi:hypothetical protein
MGLLQAGQGPLMPAMDAGTRSCTPQFGQSKEIRSWLIGGWWTEAKDEGREFPGTVNCTVQMGGDRKARS